MFFGDFDEGFDELFNCFFWGDFEFFACLEELFEFLYRHEVEFEDVGEGDGVEVVVSGDLVEFVDIDGGDVISFQFVVFGDFDFFGEFDDGESLLFTESAQ